MVSEIYIFLNVVSVIKLYIKNGLCFIKKSRKNYFARFSIGWNQIVDKIKYDHLEIPNTFGHLLKNCQFQT